jgi:hypothetical protein
MTSLWAWVVARRLVLAGAWIGIALALLHLFLDSTRPTSVDLHPLLGLAACGALVMAAAAFAWPRWLRIHALAGAALVPVAAALLFVGAAHQTGVVLGLLGVFVAIVATWRSPPR